MLLVCLNVWQCAPPAAPIRGSDGELVSLSISVSPRDLEALLESLAQVDFPINPQIFHSEARAIVRFPAYAGGLPKVRDALGAGGFDADSVDVRGMLEEIQSLLGQQAGRGDGDAG